jgi:2-polyprenyl-6-methoxyphenol hydroxylase-like FAD-dependent oxidoreductase
MQPPMDSHIETPVLIVGAGPVGTDGCAGSGVARHRRDGCRAAGARRASQREVQPDLGRSMEVFRRLGVADALRNTGLPADYRNDVVSCTTATGIELSRVPIPARGERFGPVQGADSWWPTPEHVLRINQTYMEPVLFARAAASPRVRFLNRTGIESFSPGRPSRCRHGTGPR